ncbi:MAG: hypothetical protein Tsb005_01890 [Gammaproteobacteria bacterium]
MSLLTEAYRTLYDPSARKEYADDWETYQDTADDLYSDNNNNNNKNSIKEYLATGGIAFSAEFRKKHSEYIKRFDNNPMNYGNMEHHFHLDIKNIYELNINNKKEYFSNIFEYISQCKKLQLNEMSFNFTNQPIKLEILLEIFINFLQGKYFSSSL